MKPPKLGEYDRKGSLDKHVHLVNDKLNYFSVDEAFKCNVFSLSLVASSRL